LAAETAGTIGHLFDLSNPPAIDLM